MTTQEMLAGSHRRILTSFLHEHDDGSRSLPPALAQKGRQALEYGAHDLIEVVTFECVKARDAVMLKSASPPRRKSGTHAERLTAAVVALGESASAFAGEVQRCNERLDKIQLLAERHQQERGELQNNTNETALALFEKQEKECANLLLELGI